MPVITVYRHGATAGIPPTLNDHKRAKRDLVQGWSANATRRNLRFLYSIDESQLDDSVGFAVTLTLRDCPETADDWHKARRALIKRFERMGLIRSHWVTEWQRRGVPHLHGMFFFPDVRDEKGLSIQGRMLSAWMDVAGPYGAAPQSQCIKPVTSITGWFQYLSKHAARGVSHYQRNSEGIPEGWRKTGRMWGHTGDWPLQEVHKWNVSNEAFYRYRRIAQGIRIADARATNDRRRLRSAKLMFRAKGPDKQTRHRASACRGVSEWVTEKQTQQILTYLAGEGFEVFNGETGEIQ